MAPRGKTFEWLRYEPLFKYLTTAEIDNLIRIAFLRKKGKQTIVYEENHAKEAVYFIMDGLAKTYRREPDGSLRIDSFLKKGDLFPFPSWQSDSPHCESAETITQTLLLQFSLSDWSRLVTAETQIESKIQRAYQEAHVHDRLAPMDDAESRGQVFLLKLAEDCKRVSRGQIKVGLPMTNEYFADAIGTTPEEGDRMLRQWRERGIAEKRRSGFVIHDMEALAAYRL